MRCVLSTFVVVFLNLLVISSSYGEAHLYTGTLTKLNPEAFEALSRPAEEGARFESIRLRLSDVRGIPDTIFVFDRRKLPPAAGEFLVMGEVIADPSIPVLLQGTASSRGERLHRRVAASIIGDTLTLTFARSEHVVTPRVYTLRANVIEGDVMVVRVTRLASSALAGKECEDDERVSTAELSKVVGVLSAETARVVTISTDADKEWFQKYGPNSNAEIAAILNAAEAVYERELGIRFALVKNHTYVDGSSPYVSSNASVLLRSFQTNSANSKNLGIRDETFHQDVDVKYLFSGKNLDGTTVGLAYIGAACWSPKQAYGLVQDVRRDYNITTFMHELGHTLGASHDTTERSGIMYPSLGLKNRFSEISKQQIYRHIAAFGKCIDEKQIAPNLHNATISLRAKRGRSLRFIAQLRSNRGVSIGNTAVVFTVNNKQVTRQTNPAGKAIIKVGRKMAARLRRSKAVSVVVSTADGETVSRRLKIRLS